MADLQSLRDRFEAWICASPFERNAHRYDPEESAWPGSYVDLDVELAWQAWKDSADQCRSDLLERVRSECEIEHPLVSYYGLPGDPSAMEISGPPELLRELAEALTNSDESQTTRR